jgi:hypothetical protein
MSARVKISLLTFFFAVCATSAVVTAWLQVRADANIRPADLYAIVDHQLADLQGGDFTRAYQFASTAFQQQHNLRQFSAMVQAEYPAMLRIRRVQYGEVQTHGRHATIQVLLIGSAGEVVPCVYMMVREGDGWRIDGTQMMTPWPEGFRPEGTML